MIIVVVVALCGVLSLGKANNERRYEAPEHLTGWPPSR
jgi:hypothetical protein